MERTYPHMKLLRVHLDTLVVFSLVLGVYLSTLAPGWGAVAEFNNWDGLELLLCARLGGVDHPPGHPLYLILVRAFTDVLFFVPPRLAVNLFSALCAALCTAVVYRVTADTIDLVIDGGRRPLHHAAAAAVALVLAFSVPFWQHAVIPGAYPLYLCLTAAELLAAVRWLRDGGRPALLTAGLVGGLMVSTNVLNALTMLVPLLPLLWAYGPRGGVKAWLGAAALLALGASAYAYYPVVIGAGPGFVQPMALGSPYPFGSLAWFGWYISGAAWTGQRMFVAARIPANLPQYAAAFVDALGWPALVLSLATGAATALGWRRGVTTWRWPVLLCILFAAAALPQIAIEDPSNPGAIGYLARFYLPSFLVAVPLTGVALAWLLDRVPLDRMAQSPQTLRAWQLLLAYAVLGWPLLRLGQNQAFANLRFEDSAAAWARAIYASLPPDAVIYSPLVHGQLLRYFDRIEPIVADRHLTLVRPPAASLGGYLASGRPVFLGGDCVDRDKEPDYGLMSSLVLVPQGPSEPPPGARRPFSSEVALYRVEAVREACPMAPGQDPGLRGLSNDGTFSDVLRLLGIRIAAVYPLPDGRQILTIDLSWEVMRAPGVDLIGAFRLLDGQNQVLHVLTPERIFPIGGARPTSTWKAGERLTDRVGLFLPKLPAGRYVLALGLADGTGRSLKYWPANHRADQPGFDFVLLTPIQSGGP